jgi:hypothetical protein
MAPKVRDRRTWIDFFADGDGAQMTTSRGPGLPPARTTEGA